MQLLNELRLIDRISFDDSFVRYEMGTVSEYEQKHRHHYLICMKCGKVISFRDDLLEEPEEKTAVNTGSSTVNHEVRLCGVCNVKNVEEI